jgi:hypothetical protein
MDGDYHAIADRRSFIPAMQNGMGIISYLKYYAYQGKQDSRVLQTARYMGDYLVKEAITPDTGRYPRFSRSTGGQGKFPQPPDCGSQDDKPFEIQPDKGGIAGYALLLLYDETKDARYFQQALQNARVLAANMREGTATNSPWPFRVDYRTGEPACLTNSLSRVIWSSSLPATNCGGGLWSSRSPAWRRTDGSGCSSLRITMNWIIAPLGRPSTWPAI